MSNKLRVGVLGASGYTGADLVRLAIQHPEMEIAALTANSHAGKAMAEVFPHLAFVDLPTTLVWFDEAGQHTESLESERPVGEQLLLHFHRAVSSLVRQTTSLEDAYRAMSIVIKSQQSYAEGRRIACE